MDSGHHLEISVWLLGVPSSDSQSKRGAPPLVLGSSSVQNRTHRTTHVKTQKGETKKQEQIGRFWYVWDCATMEQTIDVHVPARFVFSQQKEKKEIRIELSRDEYLN